MNFSKLLSLNRSLFAFFLTGRWFTLPFQWLQAMFTLAAALFERITGIQLGKGKDGSHSQIVQDENGVRRRKDPKTTIRTLFPETLYDILTFGNQLSENGKCLGYRPAAKKPYHWITYEEVIRRARNFGAGLLVLGAKTDCEYLVGIFSKTCVEWVVAEYGCFAYGMATAPLYDSLGAEACQQTTEFYEIEIMICGGEAQVNALIGSGNLPSTLRTIITIDRLSDNLATAVESHGVKVLTVAQVEELGGLNPHPLCLARPDSLATLIFTSGTTGAPKGAMLTHSGILLAMRSFLKSTVPITLSTEDTTIAYLPLAHIFERLMEKLIHLHGGKVGFLSGDVTSLFSDAQELHPTYFAFVPRLMTRLNDQINVDLKKSLLGRFVGKLGLAFKLREMHGGIFRKDSIWDKIIFRKYQKLLGGEIRAGITGSAATDGMILNFIRAVFGCYIFELYGQTEATGPITSVTHGDCSADHVGIPFVGVEVKLIDVPELGYFAENGCGEICSRSNFMMRAYYKMPDKTAETIDQDGWLHTGDIGMWLPSGALRIFDRKKHIFKLSQGEYLAPERLESVFLRSDLVTNIFVDGDSRYPYPVALVFPNYDAFASHVGDAELKNKGAEAIVKRKIMDDLKRLGQESGLRSYEIPQKLWILEEPFTIENNCVTQSQKTRREAVRLLHRDHLRELYKTGSA